MAKSIIVAIIKFNEMARRLPPETLTAQAAASQAQISTNSYSTLPFTTVSDTLINELGAPQLHKLAQISKENNIKAKI